MSLLLDWTRAAERGPAVAGGKGWQLGVMARLGVPVPDGFVIAAQASRGRTPGDAVDASILASVAQEIERRGWTDRPLAVRSSAPHEDSVRASFAGIHHSALNVIGAAALADAIAAVWDSAHTPAAAAYRQRMGIDAADLAMAVVVMPLVRAVASGVAFTCDPIGGRDDEMLVNAHYGYGEAVVGGHADVDEYRLRHRHVDDGYDVVARRIGGKALATHASPTGGTVLRELPAAQSARAVLTDEQALAVGALARDAAWALDYARPFYDVEWVWDGERFHVLQARPVTAIARRTYAELAGQPRLWSRGNTREVLPDPLSPLDWNLCRAMANRMLSTGYELGGYAMLPGAPHAGLFHGRVYLETSLMQWEGYDAYGFAPHAMNRLIGGEQPDIAVPPPTWRQRAQRIARLLRYLRRSNARRRGAAAALQRARAQAAAWRTQALPGDKAALSQLLQTQFEAMRGADDLFFLQGSAGGTLASLVDLLDKYCAGEGHALASALLAGGAPSVTARQGYDLAQLARVAAADAPALAWLRDGERRGVEWRERLPERSAFRAAFGEFLERYGHRANAETYFRQPRWREQPDYLFDLVLGLVGADIDALRERQRAAAAQAQARVRRSVPFALRPLVRKLVRMASAESNQREAARSALMAYLDVLRRTLLALGARFAAGGEFERDDVFNLTPDEIHATAQGRLAAASASPRVARRREQLAQWAALREPDVIAEQPDGTQAASVAQTAPRATSGEWRGTPVGTGRAQGPARVIRDARDGVRLADGNVLIAPSTDPAWTPLFLKARALVMETGGYLSHGAIVAREFGIPCVANVPGVLDAIGDGETVDVDGWQGTVRRLGGE